MTKPRELPPLEELKKRYKYNPETGAITGKSGKELGTVEKKGYVKLSYTENGKLRMLSSSRVAWSLYYDEELSTEVEIDHENRNKQDNRITNLRKATRAENVVNTERKGKYLRGVSPVNSRSKPWQAKIVYGGRAHYLGSFRTELEAHEAYRDKTIELYGKKALNMTNKPRET